MLERIKESPWYAVQVAESTDADNKATMLVLCDTFFRRMCMRTLCALLLPSNTTTTELVKPLNDYISGKLNWPFCVGICTERVAAWMVLWVHYLSQRGRC